MMNDVLWLNIKNLEEKVITDGKRYYSDIWVEVPDGATFATGDKDSFVFRKDGWYYEHGEWVKTELTFDKVGNYSQLKLFWVKGGVKDNIFTLERLLGCEVLSCDETFYIDHVFLHYLKKLSDALNVDISEYLSKLTFFTEDGDELTFDEYVQLYYPKG